MFWVWSSRENRTTTVWSEENSISNMGHRLLCRPVKTHYKIKLGALIRSVYTYQSCQSCILGYITTVRSMIDYMKFMWN